MLRGEAPKEQDNFAQTRRESSFGRYLARHRVAHNQPIKMQYEAKNSGIKNKPRVAEDSLLFAVAFFPSLCRLLALCCLELALLEQDRRLK